MSVYKEAYDSVRTILKNSFPIWNDACDVGTPVVKGDVIWNHIKNLRGYCTPEDRVYRNADGGFFEVVLMDEGAASDGAPEKDYIQKFRVYYSKFSGEDKKYPSLYPAFRKADGYVSVERV